MPRKTEMKSESDYRFAAQITSLCSEWEDNVLFDEDDPDFAASGVGGGGVTGAPLKVLRPVSQATAAAACVLNSLMLKGKPNTVTRILITIARVRRS